MAEERTSREDRPVSRSRGDAAPDRTWTLMLSVGFVGVVLLAVVGVVVFGGDGGEQHESAPTGAGPSVTVAAPSAGAVPQVDQSPPQSPPDGVEWRLYEGIAVPQSNTAGPRSVEGPVAAGYARSPVGALIATVQISTRKLVTPGEGWRQVVEQQVVAGPGREAFTEARAQVTGTSGSDETFGQVAGFRFVSYTPDVATIQIVTRFNSGTLQVTTNTVAWVDGDWKQVLQPNGSGSPTAQAVPDLTGFVSWGGV